MKVILIEADSCQDKLKTSISSKLFLLKVTCWFYVT